MFWKKKTYVDDVHEIPVVWKFFIGICAVLIMFLGVYQFTEVIDRQDLKEQCEIIGR